MKSHNASPLYAKSSQTHTGIHPTASVHPSVRLGHNVSIGAYVSVAENTSIGNETRIHPHAVIGPNTSLGQRCVIYSHAIVGSDSQDLKYDPQSETFLNIGDDNKIREFVTINRATQAGACTVIGNQNLFMAYVHIAHDCHLGDQVVLANGVTLGGHVCIENQVIIGAMSGIHQFVRLGQLSMVGAMSRICQDLPPFLLVVGHPPKVYGTNQVGIKRAGFDLTDQRWAKKAYSILYRSQLSFPNAMLSLRELPKSPMKDIMLDFLSQSKRGLVG